MQWADGSNEEFESLVCDLGKLNVKYLEQLINDLKSEFNSANKALIARVELLILERTVLK